MVQIFKQVYDKVFPVTLIPHSHSGPNFPDNSKNLKEISYKTKVQILEA